MNLESLFSSPDIPLPLVLWAMFAGFVVAMCVVLYQKLVTGKFVKFLIKQEKSTEENAATLEEAGCAKNLLLKWALRDGTTFRKVVKKTKDGRYFLPEENRDRARTAYDNKGASVFTVLIGAILLGAAVAAVQIFAPDLVQMMKNAIDMFKEL